MTPASLPAPPAVAGAEGAAVTASPVRLTEHLWQVAGGGITHPWDAAAYLVVDGDAVLVDCGSPLGAGALAASLAAVGLARADLAAVAATHGHFDHVGGGSVLHRSGVAVLLHPADAAAVAAGDPLATTAGPLYGQPFPALPTAPLADGQVIAVGHARLEVLHTPGHTPGSVCVVAHVDGRRILLAGDTLYGGFSADVGSDADAWRASLERLAGVDLDALTFGHGISRLLADPAGRIAEARLRFGSYYDPWFRPPRYDFTY